MVKVVSLLHYTFLQVYTVIDQSDDTLKSVKVKVKVIHSSNSRGLASKQAEAVLMAVECEAQ